MANHPDSVFGQRLRAAREQLGLPQDQLGVLIGIDEGSSSARISRYEAGVHEPPFSVAERLAKVLKVPTAYLYCRDDRMASVILALGDLDPAGLQAIQASIQRRQRKIK